MVNTALMPKELIPVFHRAQKYLNRYFREKEENAARGVIEILGERRILARAAFVSVDFFKTVANMYEKEKEQEAFDVARQLLFGIAHAIGGEDAEKLQRKIALQEPVGKLSVGPVRFSPAGWAFVDICPESNLSPDDNFFLSYDHPSSYESAAWLESGKKSNLPVCAVNAGYTAGWCKESFGLPLVATEITCRAKGDEACRFIMAPPSRIEGWIADYGNSLRGNARRTTMHISPEFFKRRRMNAEPDGRRMERDITERKQAEEALEFRNTILSSQQENTIDGILVVGENGAIISYNCRFVEMWEIPAEVAESRSDELALQSVLDKLVDPERFLARVRYLYEHKDETDREEIAFKDGRIFDRYSAPMWGADGKYCGRAWYFRDISEQKQAEEKRLQLEARLQEMQKLKSLRTLAGGVAQDFNTVLTAIIGYAQLARMQAPPGSPLDTYLVNIEHAAERAARLADQMLAYSGKGKGRVENVELSRLIEAFYPLLATIAFKPFKLRYLLTPDIPPIEADPAQLRQAVTALVANAAEAIGENDGAITIRTGVITADRAFLDATTMGEELPEGEYVFLEVADTGSGIAPEIMARIFDPFFSTKFVGRGLGLAAVHGIVRGHRGTIMVESRPGEGTTFRMLFPGVAPPDREPVKAETASSTFWRGRGMVLVVDDEPAVREIVKLMLEELGFTVLTAGDGREGLALCRERSGEFVAAFVDLTMPSMEGKEIVRELLGTNPGLKVVLMSGCPEEATPSAFVADGSAGFLQKPFKTRELKAVLGVLLNHGG